MFEKLLSSIGIGSVKVNTVLFHENIERGKEMEGEVHIFGGKAEQKISEIYIHIDTEFYKDDDDTTDFRGLTEPILEIKITDPVIVKPDEEKIIPFSFFVPYYVPITFGEQKIKIETEVDINVFNHPVETNDFFVSDSSIDYVLNQLTENGFDHTSKSGLCRHKKQAESNPTHCLQTFILENEQGVRVSFVGNEENFHLYVYEGNNVKYCSINRNKKLEEQVENLVSILTNK